jgi:hypothetical protein
MVIGEQLEFPITLSFISDASYKTTTATDNYKYEAVVVEANNVVGQTTQPTAVKSGGVQTALFVRIPFYTGVWTGAAVTFNKEDVVLYNGVYYKKLTASSVALTTPNLDSTNWEVTALNKIYIRFPKELGSTWSVAPTISTNSYGFFELRVTEPGSAFPRTFKPVRGLIELLYSPTGVVTDPADYTNQGIYT